MTGSGAAIIYFLIHFLSRSHLSLLTQSKGESDPYSESGALLLFICFFIYMVPTEKDHTEAGPYFK